MEKFETFDAILDFAIENEIKAWQFYTGLAEKMQNAEMKKVFIDFAKEEQGHRQILEDVKAGRKLHISSTDINVPDMKIADYTVAVEPTEDMDYKAALILAMKKEKKAFELYTALAKLVSDESAAELFGQLAQQEAKHKLHFETEYDQVVLKED